MCAYEITSLEESGTGTYDGNERGKKDREIEPRPSLHRSPPLLPSFPLQEPTQ